MTTMGMIYWNKRNSVRLGFCKIGKNIFTLLKKINYTALRTQYFLIYVYALNNSQRKFGTVHLMAKWHITRRTMTWKMAYTKPDNH